jgi:hypothetical protein
VKPQFSHFIRDTIFLGQLTKIVEDYIDDFEHMVFRTKFLTGEILKQCFINCPKKEIRAQVEMNHHIVWLDATQLAHHAHVISST